MKLLILVSIVAVAAAVSLGEADYTKPKAHAAHAVHAKGPKAPIALLHSKAKAKAKQHPGEMFTSTGAPLPTGPSERAEIGDRSDPNNPNNSNSYEQSTMHGDGNQNESTLNKKEARGNQWEATSAPGYDDPDQDDVQGVPKPDPSNPGRLHAIVTINGITTKKVLACAEPTILDPSFAAGDNIENARCMVPAGACVPPYTDDGVGGCAAPDPYCPFPLYYNPVDKNCQEPIPLIGKGNAILNNQYIGAVLVVDGEHHNEKAGRMHMAVEKDENDKLLVKERKGEEEALWNFEKVRIHTGH